MNCEIQGSIYMKWFAGVSLFGALLSMSSENWFVMWVGMELSTLSMVVILCSSPGLPFLVSSWKYLLFQGVGSLLIFLPLVGAKDGFLSPVLPMMGGVGVGLKMGWVPFHGWLIHVTESTTLVALFLLVSVQKIPPLIVAYNLYPLLYPQGLWVILVCSAIVPSLMSVGRVTVKQIFILSSILMSAWMGFCLPSRGVLVLFLTVYVFHLLFFLMSMTGFWMHGTISSLYSPSKGTSSQKFVNSLSLGALAGLPPFGVFMIKVEVLSFLLSEGSGLSAFCLAMSSGIMLFGYVKLALPLLFQEGGESFVFHPFSGLVVLVTILFPLVLILWK